MYVELLIILAWIGIFEFILFSIFILIYLYIKERKKFSPLIKEIIKIKGFIEEKFRYNHIIDANDMEVIKKLRF